MSLSSAWVHHPAERLQMRNRPWRSLVPDGGSRVRESWSREPSSSLSSVRAAPPRRAACFSFSRALRLHRRAHLAITASQPVSPAQCTILKNRMNLNDLFPFLESSKTSVYSGAEEMLDQGRALGILPWRYVQHTQVLFPMAEFFS